MEDEIEIVLNREIDGALDHMKYDGPEEIELDEETIELISRTAADIQRVVGLLRARTPFGPEGKILPVSPEVIVVAKQLLAAQINSLQRFIAPLKV